MIFTRLEIAWIDNLSVDTARKILYEILGSEACAGKGFLLTTFTFASKDTRALYKTIDSATTDMLKGRGPKGSRHENEDIDDEYEGALDVANKAKETRKDVLNDKYCITVDEYRYIQSGVAYFVNEFQIKPEDTALYHDIKRNSLYGK